VPARHKLVSTIGYERASQTEVLAALADAGIKTLIDVRDRPQSRRAGFSKRQLQASVEAAGMSYVHLQALGTPPEGREANRAKKWEVFWRIVEKKLGTAEAEFALAQAAKLAGQAPACLLCYEADWQICHRKRVAELLAERDGFKIRHLSALGSV
jgi:uncharacterized protein (DUF488 family)